LKIYVLHGSVATQLERGGICNNHKLSAQCAGERIVKIGQLSTKILTKIKCHVVFYGPLC